MKKLLKLNPEYLIPFGLIIWVGGIFLMHQATLGSDFFF